MVFLIPVASIILSKMDLKSAIKQGIYIAMKYYEKHDEFAEELKHYDRYILSPFDPSNTRKSSLMI